MSDAAYERLTSEDLGLGPGARIPVRFTPAAAWSPLVISFPHVGLAWPHDLSPKPQVDFPRNADYDVHTLYDMSAHMGAASVAAVFSRLVADLNRAADDVSGRIVPDHPAPRPRRNPGVVSSTPDPDLDRDAGRPGRGVVWATAIGNVPLLRGPLPYAQFRDRIERFHAPYYRALEILLERRKKRFGYAVLLDAHSMPSSVGPDIVLGTLDGRACDPGLQQAAERALRGDPSEPPLLSLTVNEPYLGGELVRRFGRPRDGLHALQLEVSRGVYMDERRYRLYTRPRTEPGTSAPRSRVTAIGEEGVIADRPPSDGFAAHRSPIPADPRRARRLAQLLRRVNSLVRSLGTHPIERERGASDSMAPPLPSVP